MLANDESDPELALLGRRDFDDDEFGIANQSRKMAPIFTGDAFNAVGSTIFPQTALYGRIIDTSAGAKIESPKLFINTNEPFSGIVCGVQGSGKSHSTSVLLESCLICDKRLGTLIRPLSALVFHFDTAAGGGDFPPCEAAYISSLKESLRDNATPPTVVVLVLANNIDTMRRVYSRLPEVRVEPLHFASEDLSGDRLLAMMKVDQEQNMPLYMECIMSILRGMQGTFSYESFRSQLKEQRFSGSQKAMLDLRLSILDSCLEGGNKYNRISNYFEEGQLTIIDLSSPFMDASSACGFFDIILGLFIQTNTRSVGKLVVLDEAHKYLTGSGSSSRLTDSLLSVIRQQRHLGTRVLISTQEPTVVPSNFLDLCSFVIAHRFSSPKWLDHLKEHISVVDMDWRSKVITLRTGEAMIFAPAALVLRQARRSEEASLEVAHVEVVGPLGHGYLTVRSRERITMDGGNSVLAVDSFKAQSVSTFDKNSISSSPKLVANAVQAQTPSPSPQNQYAVDDEQSDKVGVSGLISPTPSLEVDGFRPPSLSSVQGFGRSLTPAASVNTAISMAPFYDVKVETPQPITDWSSNSGVAPSAGGKTTSTSVHSAKQEARFRPLVSILQKKFREGRTRVVYSELGAELKKRNLYGKLGEFLKEAEQANLVKLGGTGGAQWVELSKEHQPCPLEYVPLVDAMRALRTNGAKKPRRSEVAMKIYEMHPNAVPGKFKTYISDAEAAGIVVVLADDRLRLTRF